MPETAPLLFDLWPSRPTTRQVSALVKAGGVSALADAERRGDDATYQEVRCRSALNRVAGMPFEWTLNPYRGCTHGCHYCYARRYHAQFELDAGDQFASVIFVKTNLIDVLRREVDRPSWTRALVALGSATDGYQPIEGHYRLTRQALEVLHASRTPVSIVTKGPMIVRDADVLAAMTAGAGCSVYVSVPSVDDRAWRALEPGTASPLQRLRAVRTLADAGIRVGVLMNPIVPGITSKPALLERTVKACVEHGARFIGCSVMYLDSGTREHFMRWLADAYPHLVDRYDHLYAGKHTPASYRAEVKQVIGMLKTKYGVG